MKANIFNVVIVFSMLILSSGCIFNKKSKVERKDNPLEENIKRLIIGKWNIKCIKYYREEDLYKKRTIDNLISNFNFRNKDSIEINFKLNGELEINNENVGGWKITNDSLKLIGVKRFNSQPLFLNTEYKLIKGNFTQNWYLVTTFFTSKGKRHHKVEYTLNR